MQSPTQPWWWRPWLRWLAWLVFLAAWTAALLHPRPGEVAGIDLSHDATFYLAKGLHLSAYAFLAVLTAALPIKPSTRRWLLFVLIVHAGATEMLQLLVPPRMGGIADVLLNLIGLATGAILTRRRYQLEAPYNPNGTTQGRR